MFRDEYKPLTSTGFAIYGLSRDLPTANHNFVTKQSLPYPLLCDPAATLITAIGMKKLPSGTIRGVFVIDKSGKVLAAEPGSPDATVNVVRRLVGDSGNAAPMDGVTHTGSTAAAKPESTHKATTEAKKSEAQPPTGSTIEKVPLAPTPAENAAKAATSTGPGVPGNALGNSAKDAAVAKVAADVADSAEKVDLEVPKPNSTSLGVPHGTMADRAKDTAMARVAAEVADTAQGVDPATPNPS
jgi:AhpC/TSA family